MPNIEYPTGVKDLVNLNADSTHPNPWKPPSRMDQWNHYYSSYYKIWKPNFGSLMFKLDFNNFDILKQKCCHKTAIIICVFKSFSFLYSEI